MAAVTNSPYEVPNLATATGELSAALSSSLSPTPSTRRPGFGMPCFSNNTVLSRSVPTPPLFAGYSSSALDDDSSDAHFEAAAA